LYKNFNLIWVGKVGLYWPTATIFPMVSLRGCPIWQVVASNIHIAWQLFRSEGQVRRYLGYI